MASMMWRGMLLAMQHAQSFGEHLRSWRQRRRMSQLDLASEAGISTRHLSFVETGRAAPSREMVLQLAEHLELPLRAQNALLVAAGFAPRFGERALDDPDLAAVRAAMELVLKAHAPNPALAIDRCWNLVAANESALKLMGDVAPALLAPPANVLRASLHPDGLAPRILNLGEWRAHIFARLERQVDVTGDPALTDLLAELRTYPAHGAHAPPLREAAPVITPLKLKTAAGVLSMFGVTTLFGMPQDVTLDELAIETFFPADAASAEMLARL
ncbi:helix-turn-helix transcriptional regulator [Vitreimonas sp.]|uniref:helix-turn-helix domain-containing protein n=1 Tax=Vitreimonas sp. TaxID=3069702 RepID=UPI002EDA7C58